MTTVKPKTIDEYINAAPPAAQEKLHQLRAILKEVAPGAQENIKWGSPVFEEKRILYSFSAHKTHINFMPTGPSIKPFEKDLAGFELGRETIKFPYDKPLPEQLIKKIAAHRLRDVRENDAKWMY